VLVAAVVVPEEIDQVAFFEQDADEIGRASCRERVYACV
jgi:hypothetical protein